MATEDARIETERHRKIILAKRLEAAGDPVSAIIARCDAENVQIASKGCGREWTESACVKTEPDYCGEGDNLCPECIEEEQDAN